MRKAKLETAEPPAHPMRSGSTPFRVSLRKSTVARALALSVKRSFQEIVLRVLDISFFCEPPFNKIKSRGMNRFLGSCLARECFVMKGVRSANWPNVVLGPGALLADRVYLQAHAPIRIGRWSMVGAETMFLAGGHLAEDLMPTASSINIGEGVFIGARALILGGVNVGDHAMVGAGATVTRDVPPLAIVAGCPARIIGYRELPDRIWSLTGTIHLSASDTDVNDELETQLDAGCRT